MFRRSVKGEFKMKRIATLVMIMAITALIISACSPSEPANELESVRQEGKMVVGTSADYPPFEYVDDAGEMIGFDIDLANEIGKQMDVEVEIIDMPFDSLIASVQEGKIDVSIAAFNYTEERDKTVDFTDAYYYAEDGFLVVEDFGGEITKAEDAANYTLGVQTGSTADGWATENLVEAGLMPEENLFRYERMDQAALDVKNGRIDILMTDYIPAQALADGVGGLKVVFHAEVSTGPVNIITPEGSTELTNAINEVITKMLEDGFIDGLSVKWIGQ
jgi:polar amino acid transport system substrate-binding protein